jgi:hypothetical protein
VQLRLLFLVFTLMTVLILMYELANPNGSLQLALRKLFQTSPPAVSQDETTRGLPGKERASDGAGAKPDSGKLPDNEQGTDRLAGVSLRREKLDRWTTMWEGLSVPERRLLAQVLRGARRGDGLAADDLARWPPLLAKLDAGWEQRHAEARPHVLTMKDDDEKLQWLTVLQGAESHWNLLKDSLQLAAEGRVLVDQDQRVLADLQDLLDEVALGVVKDNTLVNRPQEQDAWFRLFEILRETDPTHSAATSAGPVGYLQLSKQPGTYRGKLVTVRGTARMAYHVRAPRNALGIVGYYVFVVRPQGGPNYPLLVYSLETPLGFPPIQDKDVDKATTSLDEEVQFTGYFFKNCAYRARDGTRVAPLLLAKAPQWEPPVVTTHPWSQLPSATYVVAGLVAIAVVALFLATWLWRQHQSSNLAAKYEATNMADPAELKSLENVELAGGMEQVLEQMSAEVNDAEAP